MNKSGHNLETVLRIITDRPISSKWRLDTHSNLYLQGNTDLDISQVDIISTVRGVAEFDVALSNWAYKQDIISSEYIAQSHFHMGSMPVIIGAYKDSSKDKFENIQHVQFQGMSVPTIAKNDFLDTYETKDTTIDNALKDL
jgi:hypothetical protein